MTSKHNGRKYKFKIYVNKVDCMIPKFSNGKMNSVHVFENGYNAYYENTTENNGVSIEYEVKNHNRDTTITAIESQLGYVNNVHVSIINSGSSRQLTIKTPVLHQDDNILIPSSYNKYSKNPHILLGKEGKFINYGFIDFAELELPQYEGAVGFKMSPTEVSINPSRESLVWNEKTKAAILSKFINIKEIIKDKLKDKLTETDFIKWNTVVHDIVSNLNGGMAYNRYYSSDTGTQDDITTVLSKLITKKDNLNFSFNKDYKYENFNKVITFKDEDANTAIRNINVFDRVNFKVRRDGVRNWSDFKNTDIYVTDEDRADRIKDLYLCRDENGTLNKRFILVQRSKIIETVGSKLFFSGSNIKNYDDIELSDEDRSSFQQSISMCEMSPAELRKLNKKVVAKQYIASRNNYTPTYTNKVEFKISEMINNFKEDTVIYGNRDDDYLLNFIAALLGRKTDKKVLLVAQNNVKYFKDYGVHVKDFLLKKNEDKKTVSINSNVINSIRNSVISKSNVYYKFRFLNSLEDTFPIEFKIYNNLIEMEGGVTNNSIIVSIINSLIKANKTNIVSNNVNYSLNSYSGTSFNLLENLLDKGYTMEYVYIEEVDTIENLSNHFKDLTKFLSDLSNLEYHTDIIDTLLTANNFNKMENEYGSI